MTFATAINNRGQVVGSSGGRAVVWEAGAAAPAVLSDAGAGSHASAINDRGQVVGWASLGGDSHAVLWDRGTMIDLGTLGGPNSEARAINAVGQVVGFSDTAATDGAGAPIRRAFLWEQGVLAVVEALPGFHHSQAHGINAAGRVVGSSWGLGPGSRTRESIQGGRAVLWERGAPHDLGALAPGGSSVAYAINDAGHVVGGGSSAGGASDGYSSDGFLWKDGAMTALAVGRPGDIPFGTHASSINAAGQIVGTALTASLRLFFRRPFLWDRGVATDLNALLSLDPPGGPTGRSASTMPARSSRRHRETSIVPSCCPPVPPGCRSPGAPPLPRYWEPSVWVPP